MIIDNATPLVTSPDAEDLTIIRGGVVTYTDGLGSAGEEGRETVKGVSFSSFHPESHRFLEIVEQMRQEGIRTEDMRLFLLPVLVRPSDDDEGFTADKIMRSDGEVYLVCAVDNWASDLCQVIGARQ